MPLVLPPPERSLSENGANRIAVTLRRVAGADAPAVAHTVRAVDAQGQVLARTSVSFARADAAGAAAFELPSELANRIARFDVEGQPGAGATVLADARWQRRHGRHRQQRRQGRCRAAAGGRVLSQAPSA